MLQLSSSSPTQLFTIFEIQICRSMFPNYIQSPISSHRNCEIFGQVWPDYHQAAPFGECTFGTIQLFTLLLLLVLYFRSEIFYFLFFSFSFLCMNELREKKAKWSWGNNGLLTMILNDSGKYSNLQWRRPFNLLLSPHSPTEHFSIQKPWNPSINVY